MTDENHIPKRIFLENSDRSRTGDDTEVKFREDDFSVGTKVKIGQYFEEIIPEKTNSSKAAIKDGPNLGVFVPNNNSSNSFLEKQPDIIKTNFDKIGISEQFKKDIIPGDAGEIDVETQVQASKLLNSLSVDNPESISQEVSNTIQENSLFSPDNVYIGGNNTKENTAGTKEHIMQSTLGVHSPKKLFGTVNKDPEVTIKKLKNIGCQILLESSGELYIPDDFTDVKELLLARAAATVPGAARLGFRVDANRFGANEILNKKNILDGTEPSSNTKFGLDVGAKASFGNVNNPLIPFSAINSGASSIIVGTLLVKTFSSVFVGLSKLLSKLSPKEDILGSAADFSSNLEIRRKRLGFAIPKETNVDPSFTSTIFGLNENLLAITINEYSDSVQAGIESFFGFEGLNSFDSKGFTRIVESPGYYNGILRFLVKSIADPLASVSGQIKSDLSVGNVTLTNGPADYQPVVGIPADPIANATESIKLIKESRLLKFMNVMAMLGDAVLQTSGNTSSISHIDSIDDSINEIKLGKEEENVVPKASALIKKNRLSDTLGSAYKNTMAWNANTLPAMYKIGNNIINAEKEFSDTSGYALLANKRNFIKTNSNRLSTEFVKEMEHRLDTYYMPFYFHDLRTNEIISFHAFIDSILDSHTANYNESEGYGRIGKIYSYKNTNRTISLSFKTVSTSKAGFDVMWYKLNKLLMMLYPQYTLGRTISFDGKKFVQPFSQLPASSPMIRLRVGDLIKTNFNEFDLARLFGLGSSNFDVTDTQKILDERRERVFDNAKRNIIYRQTGEIAEGRLPEFNVGEKFIIKENIEVIGSVSNNNVAIKRTVDPHRGETSQEHSSRQKGNAQVVRNRNGRPPPPKIPIDSHAIVGRKISNGIYRITFAGGLAGEAIGTIYEINFTPRGNAPNYTSINFSVDHKHINKLARTEANNANIQPIITPESAEKSLRKLSQFFSSDDSGDSSTRTGTTQNANSTGQNIGQGSTGGNPIFKSFESTQGKGLAGFIKSLNFSWDGVIWDTKNANSKAPKWCTIQMEFAPVHDLNPGIDVNGNMISPLYNIGSILQQMKIERNNRSEEDTNELNEDATFSSLSL